MTCQSAAKANNKNGVHGGGTGRVSGISGSSLVLIWLRVWQGLGYGAVPVANWLEDTEGHPGDVPP